MPTKSIDSSTPFGSLPYVFKYYYMGSGPYDNSPSFGPYPASCNLGRRETISYDSGRKSTLLIVDGITHEFPLFKACSHHKHFIMFNEGSGGTVSGVYYVPGRVEWSMSIPPRPGYIGFAYGDTPSNYADKGLLLNHESIIGAYANTAASTLKYKALNESRLLGFPDAFNVINFILELRDVKRLPDLLRKWHGNTHDLSDKYLGTSFGLLPFVSDVKSVFDRVASSGPAVDKWNSMAANNKILNAHTHIEPPSLITSHPYFVKYEKGVATLEGDDVELLLGQRDFSAYTPDNGEIEVKVSFRQEIKSIAHVYFIPQTINNIGEIKRHLWGLDRPLSAVWNALPYSFVVDWFASIGDIIETFETSEPLLKMRIVSAGYSCKITTHITQRTSFGGLDTGTFISKDIRYERIPLSPGSILSAGKIYPLEFKLLSGEQTLLGSALLHQLLK